MSYVCFVLHGMIAITQQSRALCALQVASASDNSYKSVCTGDDYPIVVPKELPRDHHDSWDSASVNVKGGFR